MPQSLARFISVLFQPLLLSTYGVFLLLNTETWMSYTVFPQVRYLLYIIIIASTFFLPALTVLMFLRKGTITSLEMKEREERNWPYISTLLFYIAGWILLNKLPLPRVFGNMVMGAGLAILVAFLVNLRWKISIHMMGLGGMAGMFFAIATLFSFNLVIPLIAIVVVAGITGTARLALNAHTPAQVYVGFISGFFIEWIFVYIYNLGPFFLRS
ncbi:MAG: hypothetical protein ABI772_04245 [Bacteroidota bacterium]